MCNLCWLRAVSFSGAHASYLLLLLQALQRMHKNVGVGKLLVISALREHHRVLDNTIKLEDWSRAEALFVQVCTCTLMQISLDAEYQAVSGSILAVPLPHQAMTWVWSLLCHRVVVVLQEMRLHEAMDPRGEGLSLLHYQFSTLQFILGKLEDAQKLAQQSYDLALHTYKAESDQASPFLQRLWLAHDNALVRYPQMSFSAPP